MDSYLAVAFNNLRGRLRDQGVGGLLKAAVLVLGLLCFNVPTHADSHPVEFVVDLSGSMNRRVSGASLKEHVLRAVANAVAGESRYAIRVFGHHADLTDQKASCIDSELLVPFGSHPQDFATKKLQALDARGYTPLAYSLRALAEDLSKVPGQKVVVLLSDGADSCSGDPLAEIAKLKAQGIDVVINPIGLWIDSQTHKQLEGIAGATRGIYQRIEHIEDLTRALNAAIANDPKVAVVPTPAPTPPPDIAANHDAGNTLETALPIELNKEIAGGRLGGGSDEIDQYRFECAAGDKYEASIKIQSGNANELSARLLDGDGAELEAVHGAALMGLEIPVVTISQGGTCRVELSTSSPQDVVRYSLEVRALVRLGK